MTPDEMAALHARVFTVPRPWSAGEIAILLSSVHVVAAAEAPHGFALAQVAADEAELLTIAVVPEARRRGVGARLLARVEALARARGAERMLLEVAADNDPAIALYGRAGYAETARRRGYYRHAEGATDALILARPLAIA